MTYKLAASAALLCLVMPVSSYAVYNTTTVAPAPVRTYQASGSPAVPYSNATKPVFSYSPLASPASSNTNTNTPPSPFYGPYHFPNGTRPTYSYATSRSRTTSGSNASFPNPRSSASLPTSRSSASLPAYSESRYGNMTMPTTSSTTIAVPTNSTLSRYSPASSVTVSNSTPTLSQTPTSPTAANMTSMALPYARSEANANANYLPCVPDTFICLSYNSFLTCGNNDGSDPAANEQNIYAYPRPVAIGMECLPNKSPAGSESQSYGQQDNTPAGYYRDDRIVRSQANGACSQEGALWCSDGGGSFYMCAQGAWVYMGSVAPGTMCQTGEIAAS
ncbi:hypothetical protein MBLNU457_3143t1 [Dothideomycetes sp. NU457]